MTKKQAIIAQHAPRIILDERTRQDHYSRKYQAHTDRKARKLGFPDMGALDARLALSVKDWETRYQMLRVLTAPGTPQVNQDHSVMNKYRRVVRFLQTAGQKAPSYRQWRKHMRSLSKSSSLALA